MAYIPAQGTTLAVDDGADTDIPILGIQGYSGIDGEAPDIDETTLADLEYKVFRQGLVDNGGFTIDLFWNNSDPGQAELETIAAGQITREFTLTLPGYGTIEFFAYVQQIPIDGAVDASLTSSVTLKITGEPIYTEIP